MNCPQIVFILEKNGTKREQENNDESDWCRRMEECAGRKFAILIVVS